MEERDQNQREKMQPPKPYTMKIEFQQTVTIS